MATKVGAANIKGVRRTIGGTVAAWDDISSVEKTESHWSVANFVKGEFNSSQPTRRIREGDLSKVFFQTLFTTGVAEADEHMKRRANRVWPEAYTYANHVATMLVDNCGMLVDETKEVVTRHIGDMPQQFRATLYPPALAFVERNPWIERYARADTWDCCSNG
jgi:hypothetical protein